MITFFQFYQSIQLYKEALHAYPETLEIQLELAKSLLKAAQYSEVVVHLKSIFETTPEYHDVVLELVNEILAAFPDQLMALHLISDYYFYKSAYSECLAYLARAINIDQEEWVCFIFQKRLHRKLQGQLFMCTNCIKDVRAALDFRTDQKLENPGFGCIARQIMKEHPTKQTKNYIFLVNTL